MQFNQVLTCGSVEFGGMKALNDVPLNMLMLLARIPSARFLEVILRDGPSNSIFCTSSSTVFRALRERERNIRAA